MEMITKYMTKNGLYNKNAIINVKGMILHSVGCPGDKAENWFNSWNKASYSRALVHGFIDDEKAMIVVPCMESKGKAQKAYHVANNNTHNHYLGFEMCEYGGIKYISGANWDKKNASEVIAFAKKTYANAVELFAKLCSFHGLNPLTDGVILSHHEAYLRGMASNHGDVEHIWNDAGLSMNQFRKDVKAAMNGQVVSSPGIPDVTVTESKIDVKYQAYATGKWWDDIINYNEVNSNGYAGVRGKAMSALRANSVGDQSVAGNLQYRVYVPCIGWLDWVTDRQKDKNGDNYAGIYGRNFTAVQMRLVNCPGKKVQYRTSNVNQGYYNWVTEMENEGGYAGDMKNSIDRIQIRIVDA